MPTKKVIPFDFILEELESLDLQTKPMFGAYGVYNGSMILCILRQKENNHQDNGIWLATTSENHASLQKEFPSMRSIVMFGPGPTGWQNLPEEAHDFEEAAMRLCQLILREDPRIGKIPKIRMKAKNKKSKKSVKSKIKKKVPTKKEST